MIEPTQSEWLPHPVLERTMFEDSITEGPSWIRLAFALGFGVLGFPVAGLSLLAGSRPLSLLFAAATMASFFTAATLFWRGIWNDNRQSQEVYDEYGDATGWLVEITLYQGEAISGRDVGLLWLEDGRLFFSGARTSFALGPGDVAPGIEAGRKMLDRWHQGILRLTAQSPCGVVRLGLFFFRSEGAFRSWTRIEADFFQSFKEWCRRGNKDHGQLPPLTVGPGIPSLAMQRSQAILANGVLLGLVLCAAGIFLPTGEIVTPTSFLAGVVLALTVAFWSPASRPLRCWKAVRNRQRLDAKTAANP